MPDSNETRYFNGSTSSWSQARQLRQPPTLYRRRVCSRTTAADRDGRTSQNHLCSSCTTAVHRHTYASLCPFPASNTPSMGILPHYWDTVQKKVQAVSLAFRSPDGLKEPRLTLGQTPAVKRSKQHLTWFESNFAIKTAGTSKLLSNRRSHDVSLRRALAVFYVQYSSGRTHTKRIVGRGPSPPKLTSTTTPS